jgi:hypothetical protein
MRWGLVRVTTLACAIGMVAACASVLGLEELPLASADAGAADVASDSVGGGDAACTERGTTFCRRICPEPDFCDDFDDKEPKLIWKAPPGFPNPIMANGAQVTVEIDDAGAEGKVLRGTAQGTGSNSSIGIYSHLLAKPEPNKPPVRGVRMLASIRVVELSFLEHEGGVAGERWAGAFALSGFAAGTEGVTVLLREIEGRDELRIALSQRSIGAEGETTTLATFVDLQRDVVYQNPLELDLLVAEKEIFEREGVDCKVLDPDASPTAPRAKITFLQQGQCVALKGPLADPKWLESPMVGAGIFVTEETRAEVRVDNVAVYLLR